MLQGLQAVTTFVHTFVPPNQYYFFAGDVETMPLWALGKYRSLSGRAQEGME